MKKKTFLNLVMHFYCLSADNMLFKITLAPVRNFFPTKILKFFFNVLKNDFFASIEW